MRTLALALAMTLVACTSDDEPPPPEPGPVDGIYRLAWDCGPNCGLQPALVDAAVLRVFENRLTFKDANDDVIAVHVVAAESESCVAVGPGVEDADFPTLDRDAYQICRVELTVTGSLHWTRPNTPLQATWNLTGQQ